MAEAARAEAEAAHRAGHPSLSIGADYLWTGTRSDVEALPGNGQDALLATLGLSLPVHRGRYRGAETQARLQARRYRHRAEAEADALRDEADRTRARLAGAREALLRRQRQVALARKTLALLLDAAATGGRGGFEEVLRMQERLLDYRRGRIEAQAELHRRQAQWAYLRFRVPKFSLPNVLSKTRENDAR
jgi:outer membrane protein TolC